MTKGQEGRYGSRLLSAIHESAEELSNSGVVTKRTMRELDALLPWNWTGRTARLAT